MAVLTVTVHVAATAFGSAAMPKTTSTVLAVPIETRSFRLRITGDSAPPAWRMGYSDDVAASHRQATDWLGPLQRGTVAANRTVKRLPGEPHLYAVGGPRVERQTWCGSSDSR